MKKIVASSLLAVFLLSACGAQKPEKERFTDATVEVACMVFGSGNMTEEEARGNAEDVFAKYDFPIKDEAKMRALTEKYQGDEEVKKAVEAALLKCAGDLFKDQPEKADDAGDTATEEK